MVTDKEKVRAKKVYAELLKHYPQVPLLFLDYGTDAQMLCSIILSAQSTDAQVNKVTERLFKKYKTVKDFASADRKIFEKEIRSTGYYHLKTKRVIDCFKAIIAKHDGKVPLTMSELVGLPGVGRKTANLVLANKGIVEGIAVDTHVWRLAQRLGFSKRDDQRKIERDLMDAFDRKVWHEINGLLISHGRAICAARSPKCSACFLNKKGLCPRMGVSKSI
jgi:endonuclease-3